MMVPAPVTPMIYSPVVVMVMAVVMTIMVVSVVIVVAIPAVMIPGLALQRPEGDREEERESSQKAGFHNNPLMKASAHIPPLSVPFPISVLRQPEPWKSPHL